MQEGLRQQERVGVNPFQIGFVSGNDGHSGTPGNSEAKNWTGGNANIDDTADLRLYGEVEGGIASVLLNPAGLTGVWATENTRDAMFDGLRRRETFATSGVRLAPRLFGGWDLGDADVRDLAAAGYRKGVPMGAELPARPDDAAAPTFLAYAAKDALGANLDRIQIVKCWTTRGMLFEKVYDVAASGGRAPDPHGGAAAGRQHRRRHDRHLPQRHRRGRAVRGLDRPGLRPLPGLRLLRADPGDPHAALVHLRRRPARQANPGERAGQRPAARLDLARVVHPQRERPRRRPAAEGLYTVAQLADRGIHPMTDDEIRAVTVGRTVRSVNLVTGFEATLHYGADGNRSLMGLGDRPVVTPYEIRDDRRIETSLLGERMSVALFSVDGRTMGARDDEAGYVNYEAFTTS